MSFTKIFKKRIRNKVNNKKEIITCDNCKQQMRVPKDEGKIKVTCPKCKNVFVYEPVIDIKR